MKLFIPSKLELSQLNHFFSVPDNYAFFKQHEAIRIISHEWMTTLQQIAASLYIKKAGVEIGTIKGKDIIPSHELAVSTLHKSNFLIIEVTKEQALQYIRRKELSLDAPKGWCLVKYQAIYLGWIKILPNRINNYYPAEWRILKD